jgi:hypothetical protein
MWEDSAHAGADLSQRYGYVTRDALGLLFLIFRFSAKVQESTLWDPNTDALASIVVLFISVH